MEESACAVLGLFKLFCGPFGLWHFQIGAVDYFEKQNMSVQCRTKIIRLLEVDPLLLGQTMLALALCLTLQKLVLQTSGKSCALLGRVNPGFLPSELFTSGQLVLRALYCIAPYTEPHRFNRSLAGLLLVEG